MTITRQVPRGEYGNIYTGTRGVCNLCGINLPREKLIALSAGQTAILQRYCRAINVTVPGPTGLVCIDEVDCDKSINQRQSNGTSGT